MSAVPPAWRPSYACSNKVRNRARSSGIDPRLPVSRRTDVGSTRVPGGNVVSLTLIPRPRTTKSTRSAGSRVNDDSLNRPPILRPLTSTSFGHFSRHRDGLTTGSSVSAAALQADQVDSERRGLGRERGAVAARRQSGHEDVGQMGEDLERLSSDRSRGPEHDEVPGWAVGAAARHGGSVPRRRFRYPTS